MQYQVIQQIQDKMSIESFIRKVSVQTALYWGNPVNNGSGGYTFDTVEEIKCRWDDKTEIMSDDKGKEFVSRASILSPEELEPGGYLCLASLDDFDSGQDFTNPKNIAGAYMIRKKEKTPMIKSTTVFVRTVYI